MNFESHQQSGTATIDIDPLFLDSYLLVIELRQGFGMSDSKTLRQQCIAQVESARNALRAAGMSVRSIDLISHAQCALLDEAVLANAKDSVRHAWANESLQARFFGHHRAGETLYEEMRQVLEEPAPDPHVLTIYRRVMMLGFLGSYRALDDEGRVKLKNQLNAGVVRRDKKRMSTVIDGRGPSREYLRWIRSPILHLVSAVLAVAVLWWVLDKWLSQLVATIKLGGA